MGNKVVVVRQRDDLEAPVDDMNEETDSAEGELPDDSDSTRARLLGGTLVKSVSVPTFVAETIHGPQGSTLRAIEIVTGCLDSVMEIENGAETQILMIHVIEGGAGTIRWMENIIAIIVLEQTRGVTECVQNIVAEALRIKAMGGDTAEDTFS
jgi:hypothetical protein